MKNKNKKHKESTIGKIIYGFMLFAPLLAIGTTCLVNTFNADAKNESNVIYKYKTNDVYSVDDLKPGNIYTYTVDLSNFSSGVTFLTGVLDFYNLNGNSSTTSYVLDNNHYMNFYYVKTGNYLQISYSDVSESFNNLTIFLNDSILTFDVVRTSNYISTTDSINNYSKCLNLPIERVENKNISNVFYDSITAVENNSLFNWSKNSIIYTGLQATCETLSISNTFIPMLLTYWLIMSVLYFLYDIVLMILNTLHRKIHELQDSI